MGGHGCAHVMLWVSICRCWWAWSAYGCNLKEKCWALLASPPLSYVFHNMDTHHSLIPSIPSKKHESWTLKLYKITTSKLVEEFWMGVHTFNNLQVVAENISILCGTSFMNIVCWVSFNESCFSIDCEHRRSLLWNDTNFRVHKAKRLMGLEVHQYGVKKANCLE